MKILLPSLLYLFLPLLILVVLLTLFALFLMLITRGKIKGVLLILFVLFSAVSLRFYKTPPIVGRVIDITTREPIPNVEVAGGAGVESISLLLFIGAMLGGIPCGHADEGDLFWYETVTDKEGRFFIPGMISVFFFGLFPRFHDLGVVTDHPLYTYTEDTSRWDSEQLKLLKEMSHGWYLKKESYENAVKNLLERGIKGFGSYKEENKKVIKLLKNKAKELGITDEELYQKLDRKGLAKILSSLSSLLPITPDDIGFLYAYKNGKLYCDIKMISLEDKYIEPMRKAKEQGKWGVDPFEFTSWYTVERTFWIIEEQKVSIETGDKYDASDRSKMGTERGDERFRLWLEKKKKTK